ncbi:MAG: hypothetical protein H6667_18785 [Ardenticatenaceae bacterium]|nr:hypothetical protein [Ardenticatenaceae bacterium]
MDYGRLLVSSWQFTWRHKFLWPFGLILALGSVVTAVFRFTYLPQFMQFVGDPTGIALDAFVGNNQYWTWLLGGTAVLFILSLAFWLVWATAQGAIITAVNEAEAGRSVFWRQAVGGGMALLGRFIAIDAIVFFPLFLLLLLLMLLATGLMLAFTWQMMRIGSTETAVTWIVAGLACLLPLTCLLLPLGMLTSVLRTLAFRETAIQPQKVRASIRQTWQVMKRQWGAILVVWALVWGMQTILNVGISGLALPLGGVTAVAPALGRWLGWLVGVGTAVPLMIWHTYTAVLWTMVYRDLAERPYTS